MTLYTDLQQLQATVGRKADEVFRLTTQSGYKDLSEESQRRLREEGLAYDTQYRELMIRAFDEYLPGNVVLDHVLNYKGIMPPTLEGYVKGLSKRRYHLYEHGAQISDLFGLLGPDTLSDMGELIDPTDFSRVFNLLLERAMFVDDRIAKSGIRETIFEREEAEGRREVAYRIDLRQTQGPFAYAEYVLFHDEHMFITPGDYTQALVECGGSHYAALQRLEQEARFLKRELNIEANYPFASAQRLLETRDKKRREIAQMPFILRMLERLLMGEKEYLGIASTGL